MVLCFLIINVCAARVLEVVVDFMSNETITISSLGINEMRVTKYIYA